MKCIRRYWFGATVIGVVVTTASIVSYCLFSQFGQTMRTENQDDYLVAIFTVILGGGAIIQGLYLARQDRAVQESIKNSEEGLKAAREANGIAVDTAKQEQRAYLSIKFANIKAVKSQVVGEFGRNLATGDWHLQIDIKVVNRGQTPASDVAVNIACVKGLPQNFEVEKWVTEIFSDTTTKYDFYEYFGVLHSGEEITIENALIRGLKQDFKDVLWMVFVDYKDAFGDKHKESRTEYIELIFGTGAKLLYPKGCVSQ